MKKQLQEHIDFYYNEQGYVVLTEKFHLERGFCCGNGCLHCPFNYEKVPGEKRKLLLEARRQKDGA
ncbi:DUF5522 domain-containing protein [Chitinophaga deserti]|uniref:DUF5522 domain-containing protein n=1 Tax=Chitinophaga deserti TaxID=2164099 RepID=UPI000D6BA7EF|nr:DUF5522 domain-containing protein [Chitinophaga deserti]